MEVQTRDITGVKKSADITASPEEIKPHIDQAFEKFRDKAEIKGFRKGKAPMSLIKKMYGPSIESDALGDIVNQLYKRAVDEHALKAIGEPVLVDMDYKPGEKFSFSVEYEVFPEIEIQEISDVKVEKQIYRVTEEQVEREIESIRVNNAVRSEAESVTDKFYTLTLDIQELDADGVAIIGKRSQDVVVQLYDPKYDKEFIEPHLSAVKEGEMLIRYNHDHGDHKHKVHVKTFVKRIEKLDLPELTDEFVKEKFPGKYSSVDELRSGIRERIQNLFDEQSSREVRNKIADELVKRHEFPIPETLLRSIFDEMIEQIKRRSQTGSLPPDFDRDGFEAEYYKEAEWQAKWDIIRTHLIEKEKFEIRESDIVELAQRDAAALGITAEQVLNYYKSNDSIVGKLENDKLMQKLESMISITPVPAKQQDSTHSH